MRRAPRFERAAEQLGRLCRLACRSFRRKQTPLSIRIFAITGDASRAFWWQVEGVTERFLLWVSARWFHVLFAMKGKQNEAAVLKPEGEALLIRTVLGRLGAAGGAEGGACGAVRPLARREAGGRSGGGRPHDVGVCGRSAWLLCALLRMEGEGCARIPRPRL